MKVDINIIVTCGKCKLEMETQESKEALIFLKCTECGRTIYIKQR